MGQEPKMTPDWIKDPETDLPEGSGRFAEGEPEETPQESVMIGGYRAREQERKNETDGLREPDRFADGEVTDFGGICDLVLRGIGIGMGVAVTVLSTLGAIQSGTAFIMLGVGLTAVAISVMKKM